MTTTTILWAYFALLMAGGLMGFIKAKSKASLIMSVAFAIPIAFCALGKLPLLVAEILIGFLLVFFGMRFIKGRKMMPGGMMTIASAIALGLLLLRK